ncbi:hypothetical protein BBAD15_g7007 [Beauveria bassiana D1-5]|uniref:Uncharacterized protein n=1 Tax=Beauveria bassiana D1-5 TaxID=1245745 RepID=A0A0A2VN01_BEABA|nr:hypothetical protein BBAD15_g7007 [Beauveria bassiana D1-5]
MLNIHRSGRPDHQRLHRRRAAPNHVDALDVPNHVDPFARASRLGRQRLQQQLDIHRHRHVCASRVQMAQRDARSLGRVGRDTAPPPQLAC